MLNMYKKFSFFLAFLLSTQTAHCMDDLKNIEKNPINLIVANNRSNGSIPNRYLNTIYSSGKEDFSHENSFPGTTYSIDLNPCNQQKYKHLHMTGDVLKFDFKKKFVQEKFDNIYFELLYGAVDTNAKLTPEAVLRLSKRLKDGGKIFFEIIPSVHIVPISSPKILKTVVDLREKSNPFSCFVGDDVLSKIFSSFFGERYQKFDLNSWITEANEKKINTLSQSIDTIISNMLRNMNNFTVAGKNYSKDSPQSLEDLKRHCEQETKLLKYFLMAARDYPRLTSLKKTKYAEFILNLKKGITKLIQCKKNEFIKTMGESDLIQALFMEAIMYMNSMEENPPITSFLESLNFVNIKIKRYDMNPFNYRKNSWIVSADNGYNLTLFRHKPTEFTLSSSYSQQANENSKVNSRKYIDVFLDHVFSFEKK